MTRGDLHTGPGGCHAALIIKGKHYWCEERHPHRGLPHGSRAAEAIWRGEGPDEDPAVAWAEADPENER